MIFHVESRQKRITLISYHTLKRNGVSWLFSELIRAGIKAIIVLSTPISVAQTKSIPISKLHMSSPFPREIDSHLYLCVLQELPCQSTALGDWEISNIGNYSNCSRVAVQFSSKALYRDIYKVQVVIWHV